MSQTNFLINLITSLEDPEFDKVAKLFLNEVDGITNIINCNGPYDKGIDMRHVNVYQLERQYQITTIQDKGFHKKLLDDLEKAKKNVDDYQLPNKVKYFYSSTLTNNQILKYKKLAKDKYDIILEIIDANAIAETGEHYDSIKNLLFELSDIDKYRGGNEFFDDPRVKSFYDLMSFGSSTDIKYNILRSHVLYYLFENSRTSISSLLLQVNEHFTAKFEANYFDGLLRRMSSERLIHYGNGNVDLTQHEKDRLNALLQDFNDEETILKRNLFKVLEKFKIEEALDEIIHKLCELYESNFAINLGEFTKKNLGNHDFQTATKNFNEYLKSKLEDDKQSENIVKELLSIADNSEILSRIAAGQVYTKVNDPDRLQDYITQHNNNKTIFLDTNFIIVALCVHYESNSFYDNSHFKIAKHFLQFAKKNNLNLVTLKSYAIETASLFKDALDIIPFTKLSHFDSLGGSTNILFKFFKNLKDNNELHEGTESFEDFLREFKFETKKGYLENNFFTEMEWLLGTMDISVEIPKMYDISKVKEMISKDLSFASKHKSNFAISNDAIMLMRLGDKDVDINPMDPIFCTWDMSLFRLRKTFFEEFLGCTQWLMYTPTRLMDHFSMMNFQVRKGTLFNEVLSILEVDFSFQEKTQTLLDSMLTIINPNNTVGLQYANKLAELRQQEIVQVDENPENISEDVTETNAVDIVFHKLFNKYSHGEEGVFHTFKEVFTKQEYFDDVLQLLKNQIDYVKKSNGEVNIQLFEKMDIIIKKLDSDKIKI